MLTMQGFTLLKNAELFCEENGLRLAPDPPSSPDLASSDFFLFGYVKERLKAMLFLSYEELLGAIGEVVTSVELETLTALFEHWMERLKWVSKNNGDYYPETTSWLVYFSPMFIRN
jgi:hypothetical protein